MQRIAPRFMWCISALWLTLENLGEFEKHCKIVPRSATGILGEQPLVY
jgi:hypothetical protein